MCSLRYDFHRASTHIRYTDRLDERWGTERSAKGTRFKLNRDMAGYSLTNRSAIVIEDVESKVRITLPNPEKLRTAGELVGFENVGFMYPARSRQEKARWVLNDVTFTVGQGGRAVFIGAVSDILFDVQLKLNNW